MRDSFISSLLEIALKDENIILLTADLGFGIFDEFEKQLPNQFFNVGISEQNMTGLATGLSLEGKKVVTYSIGNFPTFRCLEQIRNDACYHDVNVTIVASGGGYSYGQLGYSHHATEDISIMRTLPNTTIVAPCSDWEAKNSIKMLVEKNGVGYLRLDKTFIDSKKYFKNEFQLYEAKTYIDGEDITLMATGGIVREAIAASEELKKYKVSARVVSIHTLKPIDENVIEDAINNTGGIITIEENSIIGGLAGAISEYCLENNKIPKKFKRIGINDQFSSIVGTQDYLRKINHLDYLSIVKQVLRLIK
jgi:transketolase